MSDPNPVVKPHALVLRVMRLAKPKFYAAHTLAVDPADEFASDIAGALHQLTGQETSDVPLTNFLMAPQSIDHIYLGETFTFYMAILNSSQTDLCSNLTIQASLQTQTQKILLNAKIESETQLAPQESLGRVISHEIKEVGQHILVCEVNYTLENGEVLNLRKFFKFPVHKPLDVRTKFFSTEDHLCEDVYLEAQIQNLCLTAITLERVDLQPSTFYRRNDGACVGKLDKSNKRNIQLNPQDIYQFLFSLSPNLNDHSYSQFRGVSTIGNLDIRWRTEMGEPGRLQTSPLTRLAPAYGGDLRLLVEKIPGQVQWKQLFRVDFRVLNCSERSLDLVLTLVNGKNRPFLFASPSGLRLGHVLPQTSAQFHLEILPLEKGVHFLSGIRITDAFLKRTYEMDELAQILVT